MTDVTPFAGLEAIGPGESLTEAFLDQNPRIIDALLRVGAVTHHHDGHAALADPALDPVVDTNDTGGTIPADLAIYVAYTFVDVDDGETIDSSSVLVTTAGGLTAPGSAPELAVDNVAGTLLTGNYYYAVSVTDGVGGETPLGPTAAISIDPGSATNEIQVTALDTILASVPGAVTWRLWRAIDGGQWEMLNEGATAAFTDDGSHCVDCGLTPPTGQGTKATNQLLVTVPAPADLTRIASFNIYASADGTFDGDCLLGNFAADQLGVQQTFSDLTILPGRPPRVSLALPGANRIVADEILGPWKSPVATAADLPATGNADQDIRMTEDDATLHRWLATDSSWHVVGGGGGGTLQLGAAAATWVKLNGDSAIELIGEERFDHFSLVSDGFDVDGSPPAGWSNVNLAASGGVETVLASGNSTDIVTYHGSGSDMIVNGEISLDYTVEIDNYYRIGVTFGHGAIGLFGMIDRNNGRLSIKIRRANTGAEADYVELAGVADGGPEGWTLPAVGDGGTLTLTRTHNDLTLNDSRQDVTVNATVPVGDQATWGDGIVDTVGQALRWEVAGAFTIDNFMVTRYDTHYQLKVRFTNVFGTVTTFFLVDDTGKAPEVAVTNFGANWQAGAAPPSGSRDVSGNIHLRGRIEKDAGAAPVANETICTLPASLKPAADQLLTVVTGDADGMSVGIISIAAASGVVKWLSGTSTDPATKSPYVRFDGLSFRGT